MIEIGPNLAELLRSVLGGVAVFAVIVLAMVGLYKVTTQRF